MNSNNLSREQARQVHAALVPTLRYLNRLTERLNARSFPPHDRLYRGGVLDAGGDGTATSTSSLKHLKLSHLTLPS
jgi:hypothetical protein